jgi:hypothetical protein
MTADWSRANARIHANATRLGIDHSILSGWAAAEYGVWSMKDLTPDQMDDLSKEMEAQGDDFAKVFIEDYGPKSIMQFRLLDVPETPSVDRFTA